MPDVPGTVNFPTSLDSDVSLIEAANNATTQLASNLSTTDTTITVDSTTGFPASGALSIGNEVIYYGDTYNNTVFLYCIRGQDGTAAAVHTTGASVQGRIVAAHHTTLVNAVLAIEAKLGTGNSFLGYGKIMRGSGTGTSEWTDNITMLADGKVGMGTTDPHSRLQVVGPIATALATKTAAYTLSEDDSVLLANATNGPFTLTLPTAVGIAGRQYTIKKIDSASNAVTIGTTSSETIDGAATLVLTSQWAYQTVVSDGTNWFII
jgi:hypothetical protein